MSQLSNRALNWKPPSPASTSSQAGSEMGDEEKDWGPPALISLQGLLPDCHLEVTPDEPGSPPPQLQFPWGQMSFQRQHQASAARPDGEEGPGGGGAGPRASAPRVLHLFHLPVSTVSGFLSFGPSLQAI